MTRWSPILTIVLVLLMGEVARSQLNKPMNDVFEPSQGAAKRARLQPVIDDVESQFGKWLKSGKGLVPFSEYGVVCFTGRSGEGRYLYQAGVLANSSKTPRSGFSKAVWCIDEGVPLSGDGYYVVLSTFIHEQTHCIDGSPKLPTSLKEPIPIGGGGWIGWSPLSDFWNRMVGGGAGGTWQVRQDLWEKHAYIAGLFGVIRSAKSRPGANLPDAAGVIETLRDRVTWKCRVACAELKALKGHLDEYEAAVRAANKWPTITQILNDGPYSVEFNRWRRARSAFRKTEIRKLVLDNEKAEFELLLEQGVQEGW